MKYVLVIMLCLVLCGCHQHAQNGSAENRAALIERLQRDYPETWRQELAKHDEAMRQMESVTPAPSHGPGYVPDPDIPNYQRSPYAFPDVRSNP